jgi:hypothetical protein
LLPDDHSGEVLPGVKHARDAKARVRSHERRQRSVTPQMLAHGGEFGAR